jgi:hypothetical protein
MQSLPKRSETANIRRDRVLKAETTHQSPAAET